VQLYKISAALKQCKSQKIRDLNLSNNPSLFFNSEKMVVKDEQFSPDEIVLKSLKFVKNMCSFIRSSDVLNHLDISAMGFSGEEGQQQLLMFL